MPAIDNHQATPDHNSRPWPTSFNLPTREDFLAAGDSASTIIPSTRRAAAHIIFTHVWNGLAIFAIVVIIRHLSTKALAWKRRKAQPAFDPYNPPSWKHRIDPRIGPVFQPRGPVLPGERQLHYRFAPPGAPPFWMMEPRSRGVSFTDPLDDREKDGGQDDLTGEKSETKDGESRRTQPQEQQPLRVTMDPGPRQHFMSRPPPPPPLTPPDFASPSSGFPFDARRRPRFPPAPLDDAFIHQPNPDYMAGADSTSTSSAMPAPPPGPRRRSYTKTVPVGIPTPQHSSVSGASSGTPASAAEDEDGTKFAPSSFPPSGYYLPPPPPPVHHGGSGAEEDDGEGYEGHEGSAPAGGIEVQGEVISMTGHDGLGWTRHTRVYGGGVCLACAASGGEGGFYGATVREEDKR